MDRSSLEGKQSSTEKDRISSCFAKPVRSENNTFTAYITPQTFLLATLITCLFSILIERLLTRKVPSINMVEALKSVE